MGESVGKTKCEDIEMMKKLINTKYFVWIILVISLVMRLIAVNQSLWLDEAIGALAVRDFSYSEIITNFLRFDNHPPLYYLDLKSWTSVFGYSEMSLRMPSVIYGVLTVYLVFLIAKIISKGKSNLFPILSALLLATSQFHIYYSQEARMYSLTTFLAALAVYSFLFLIDNNLSSRLRTWKMVLFSFSITALVFTDYVPIFLLPVFWITGFIGKKDRKWWIGFICSHIPLVALGALWTPTFLIQVEKGKWLLAKLPAWQQVAGGATFKQAILVWMKFVFGRISLVNKGLYYFLIILASVPTISSMTSALRNRTKHLNIMWLWLVLPLVVGFIASFWFPAFIYFRFLYVIPAFYLIISWGVVKIKSNRLRSILVISLLMVNMLGWFIYITDATQQREEWRQAVDFVESNLSTNDIVIFNYPEPFAPYRWYANKLSVAVGVTDSISANITNTYDVTKAAVEGKNVVYYFEYLKDLSDPRGVVQTAVTDLGYKNSESHDFYGVGFINKFER